MRRWLGLADLVLQQGAWWVAVLAAARGRPGVAALAGATLVLLHLALRPVERGRVAVIAAATAALGLVADGALTLSGLIDFAGAGVGSPAWMVGLWGAFGVGLTASLERVARWRSRWLAVAAAAAGPLAYRAGASLGAITFPHGDGRALLGVALAWAVVVPIAAAVARALSDEEDGAPVGPGRRGWRWAA